MTQSPEMESDVLAEEPVWRSDVKRAARDFAAALSETPEFNSFEQAYLRLDDDQRAQEAWRAYEAEQLSLQSLLMLGAASEEQRAELERLREAWMAEPSVVEYLAAEAALYALCQGIDQPLSEHIGLGFAATCSSVCCS